MNVLHAAIGGPNSYTAILAEAWQQHCAAKAENAPTVISLFAGCGGSSLGYSMAGYQERLAVEWEENAVATFRLNFPTVPVFHGDIRTLAVSEILRMTNLRVGELDVLDGSPPCQGFSTAGKRKFEDMRNSLFQEYVRILQGLQPKAFIMENVPGLIKGKMKVYFAAILRALKHAGYQVIVRLMNAAYFFVPQQRQRLIFMGTRKDLSCVPGLPAAQSHPLSVQDALQNVKEDPGAFQVPLTTKMYQVMRYVRPGGHQPEHFSHVRLPLHEPAGVIDTGGGLGHYHYWHPIEHRVLTFMELRRLASFPEEFQLTGSMKEQWIRIGNSVPPLFMRAIAQHVRGLLAPAVQAEEGSASPTGALHS